MRDMFVWVRNRKWPGVTGPRPYHGHPPSNAPPFHRMLGLARGARIVTSTPFAQWNDALKGTQLLLTAAGRRQLADHYKDAFLGGAAAVSTSLNTSQEMLDEKGFWADMTRDNDL